MSQPVTNQQASAAVELMRIAYALVASHGAQGMPSGHLYAQMMSAFSSVSDYESMINLLVKTQLLARKGDLLIAAKI